MNFLRTFFKNRAEWLILVLAVFLFSFFLIDRGGIHLTSYFLLGISVAPFFIFWLLYGKKHFSWFHIWLLLFVFFVWLSFFFSPLRSEGFRELIAFTVLPLIFVFLSSFEFSETAVRRFFQFLLVIGVLELFYAFFVYLHEPFNRLAGSFRDSQYSYAFFPNAFANFLLFLLPLSVSFFLSARRKWVEMGYFVLSVFFLAGFLLTYSRGALLALSVTAALFFIVFGFLFFKKRSFWMKIFKVVFLILVSFFLSGQINALRGQSYDVNNFGDKITFQASEKGASFEERLDFWKGSVLLIMDRPLLGFGPYSFSFVYPRYQQELLALSDHPHNIFLKIGVENGLLALMFFLCFLFSFLARFRIAFFIEGHEKHPYLPVVIFVLLSSLLHNLVDYNFNFLANFFLFWIFLVFLFVKLFRSNFLFHPRRFFIGFFAGATVIFFLFVVHEAYYGYFFKKGRLAFAEKKYETALMWYGKAKPLWIERSLMFDDASAAFAQYEKNSEERFLEEVEQSLALAVQGNPYQAFYLSTLTELRFFRSEISDNEAQKNYLKALSLDPFNNLGFYRNLLSLLASSDPVEYQARIPYVLELLKDYKEKLMFNEHLTVLTDNPRYATEMYGILARHSQGVERQEYLGEQREIFELWKEKAEEMSAVYGIDNVFERNFSFL